MQTSPAPGQTTHTSDTTVPRRASRLVHAIPARLVSVFRSRRAAAIIVTALMAVSTALAGLAVASEPTLLRFDRSVQAFLLDARTAWLNSAMVWLTFLGTRYAIGAAAFALILWSLVTGKHRTFVLIIGLAVLLNPVVEVGFKELVDRVRPAVDQLLPGRGPSFPSGHVLASVGFYGLLPFLAWEATRSAAIRFAAFVGSLFVVTAVTVSRPYLDVHWATDAIAGVLLGMVLVVATYHAYLRIASTAGPSGLTGHRFAHVTIEVGYGELDPPVAGRIDDSFGDQPVTEGGYLGGGLSGGGGDVAGAVRT